MSSSTRLSFIDWFKAIGMTLIVYGHTAGWAPLATFPPIYIKQIGVTLFLFAAGYSLAKEQRPWNVVLFRRLFEMFFFGLTVALIVSAGDLITIGRIAKSNYLPFILGANVLLNQFPANPTTWYIGTYTHLLLLWALVLRRISLSRGVIGVVVVFEIVIRAFLLRDVGDFVAYVALTNWITVFLLGYYCGQRGIVTLGGSAPRWSAILALGTAVWLYLANRLPFAPAFPLMQPSAPGWLPLLLTSTAITFVYVGVTLGAFGLFTVIRAPRVVSLVARNTILVFIAHMPICHVVLRVIGEHPNAPWWPTLVLATLSLPGLTFVSEAIHKTGLIETFQTAVSRKLLVRERSAIVATAQI